MDEEIIFTEPLVEKYRPDKLDDIIGNKNEVKFLKLFLENNNVPNIILTGEPGGGKTSAIIAFAKEYLIELFDDYCIELNASDDRGIDTVRTKIKFFAQKKKTSDKKKIIILDESDNMTQSAQIALRNMMDTYEEQVCFLFTCNNVENIVDAIQSRCKIMFFGKIGKEEMRDRIGYISKKEGINITLEGIDTLINLSENPSDMRSILNMLELVRANFPNSLEIKNDDIYKICDKPSPLVITEAFKDLLEGKIKESIQKFNNLKREGFLNIDISTTLINEILSKNLVKEEEKEKILKVITKFNEYFLEGYDSYLQLGNMIVEISLNL